MTRLKINKFQTKTAETAGKAEMSLESLKKVIHTNNRKFQKQCVEKKLNIWHKIDNEKQEIYESLVLETELSLREKLIFVSNCWKLERKRFFGCESLTEGLETRLSEGKSGEEILRAVASKVSFRKYHDQLKRVNISLIRHKLQSDRKYCNFLRKRPDLYPNLEKSCLEYLYDRKNKNYAELNLKENVATKKYMNIVKTNIEQLIVQYYSVTNAYKNAMMQTEFKLQLVLGSDVAKYILYFL